MFTTVDWILLPGVQSIIYSIIQWLLAYASKGENK